MDLELPEQYLLGAEPAVYAVYTLNGGAQQESIHMVVLLAGGAGYIGSHTAVE